jgi:hypothetical protein
MTGTRKVDARVEAKRKTADLSTALRSGRDDKFVAQMFCLLTMPSSNYAVDCLTNLSSRPERSAVERSAVFHPVLFPFGLNTQAQSMVG